MFNRGLKGKGGKHLTFIWVNVNVKIKIKMLVWYIGYGNASGIQHYHNHYPNWHPNPNLNHNSINVAILILISNPDSANIVNLITLAINSTGKPGLYASYILELNGIIEYKEPIVFPIQLLSSEIPGYEQGMKNKDREYLLDVFPNPIREYIIVKYRVPEYTGKKSIEIFNLKGISKMSKNVEGSTDEIVISVKGLEPGIYVVSLIVDNKLRENTKFTIIR